jgi:predicted nucleic acid-binding protein
VFPEQHHVAARAQLGLWQQLAIERLAPALFSLEVCSGLLKRCRRNALAVGDAQSALSLILAGVSIQPDDPVLAPRALEIAYQLAQRNAYDSLYLALAEHEGCEYWTADQRLFNAAGSSFPFVNWIGRTPIP